MARPKVASRQIKDLARLVSNSGAHEVCPWCRCPKAPKSYRVSVAAWATVVGVPPIKSAAMSLHDHHAQACPITQGVGLRGDHGWGHKKQDLVSDPEAALVPCLQRPL